MCTIAHIACSLDGFIAGQNDDLEWLNTVPPSSIEYYDFDKLQNDIDCILMGRKTFDVVKRFGVWPYRKLVFVLTNTVSTIDDEFKGKIKLINGEIKEILEKLNRSGYSKIYVDGGNVIQQLINESLLDEMIITTISKMIGSGIRLFDNIKVRTEWELEYSKMLNNEMVMCKYKRK